MRTTDGDAEPVEPPVHSAIESGDVGALLALLASGADPNERDRYGATPLQTSVDFESVIGLDQDGPVPVEFTRLLLEFGADPMAAGQRGASAWEWAHELGHRPAQRLFAEWTASRGIDVPAYVRVRSWGDPSVKPSHDILERAADLLGMALGRPVATEELASYGLRESDGAERYVVTAADHHVMFMNGVVVVGVMRDDGTLVLRVDGH